MQKLKKIDGQTNVLTWFEIPVSEIDRAKTFYETILGIEMVKRADGNDEAVFFPFDPNIVQATSGRVTGVLSKTERNSPSGNGTVVSELLTCRKLICVIFVNQPQIGAGENGFCIV